MNTDDTHLQDPGIDDGIDLVKYWNILKPKIHIPIFLAVVFMIGIFIRTSLKPDLYYSEGMLIIEPETNVVNFGNERFYGYRNEYFNSQITILQSNALKEKVMAQIGVYPGALGVTPLEMTYLVKVSYVAQEPEMAARVINTVFDTFIKFNLELKTQSSRNASEYISEQVVALRSQISKKEEELQEYGNRKEIFYVDNDRNTTVVENFAEINRAYTQARINRINKESYYNELLDTPFSDYPEVKNNPVITNIKSSISSLESKYQNKSQIYKESYPEMVQLRSEIESLEEKLKEETQKVAQRILSESRADYQSEKKREESLQKMLEEQKNTLVSSKTSAIYYQSLNIEINNMRRLLDFLLKRQKESLVSSRMEGVEVSNIKIIDRANPARRPMSKGLVKKLIMALFLGTGLGVGLIFGVDFLDRSIKDTEDIKTFLKISPLGFIPSTKSKKARKYYYNYKYSSYHKNEDFLNEPIELINQRYPDSPFAESYRNIRTSILLSNPDRPKKVISISSAKPGEGKSTTAVNLGYSFSKLGKKVLLVDTDIRKSNLHKILKIDKGKGLTSYLTGETGLSEIITKLPKIPNMYLIQAGKYLHSTAELFQSQKTELMIQTLRENFDHIILDMPPLIGIVDPIIISRFSDGVLLVIWGGRTRRDEVERCKKELDRMGVNIFGGVLNNVDYKRESYTAGYMYAYKYHYKYQER